MKDLGAFYIVDAGFSWQEATSPSIRAAEFQEITREQFLALGGDEDNFVLTTSSWLKHPFNMHLLRGLAVTKTTSELQWVP